MAQYVHGGELRTINVEHIVALKLQQGSLRSGSHKDRFSYPHYLVAETSDGALHELGYWDSPEIAWSARESFISSIGNGEQMLTVSDHPDLHSGHILDRLETTVEAVENWLRAIEGRLNP